MAFGRREILLLADICIDLYVKLYYGIDELGREVDTQLAGVERYHESFR